MALADLARSAAATLTSLAADLDELAKDLDSLEADSAATPITPVVPVEPSVVPVDPTNPVVPVDGSDPLPLSEAGVSSPGTSVASATTSTLADPPEVVATADDMRETNADNTSA